MSTALKPVPPALPATKEDWLAERRIKDAPNILDWVEDIHLSLLANDDKRDHYQAYINAIYDSQAVEGTMECDDQEAARMIRETAVATDPNHPLGKEKLKSIIKAWKSVLRRYRKSRKERRQLAIPQQ